MGRQAVGTEAAVGVLPKGGSEEIDIINLSKVINMQELRQKQEDPLNLRSLPMLKPEQDGWPAIETALLEQNRQHSLLKVTGGTLAIAALPAAS